MCRDIDYEKLSLEFELGWIKSQLQLLRGRLEDLAVDAEPFGRRYEVVQAREAATVGIEKLNLALEGIKHGA